jgi:hypothetical protein
MELRPSDYMRVLDAQGRSQGQSGRREAERLHRESGSSLDFNTWMSINRPVMNNGQMYIASDPEHANIMNHIATGNQQPLNLGAELDMPIWEGATQEDNDMTQWMSSGSNLDFGSWLKAGKPEAFDMTPPPAPSNLNVPISKESPVDFNSMTGPEMTAYLKKQYPEQNFSKSSSSAAPVSNFKKYLDEITPTQRAKINDRWRQAHSSGETDLDRLGWVNENWDSFSDILADTSGPDEQSKLMNEQLRQYNASIRPPENNVSKYMNLHRDQRSKIKDLWNQSQSSGQTSLFEWVDKNWDSFSDILGNSGGQKQIPAPDNRTVPISKELPKMFDNRTVPISKEPPKMFDNITVPISKEPPKMETASTPVSQTPQDRAISAMQPNTMRDVAKDNYTSAGMTENKTLTDQRQATTDARQAAFEALKKRRMQ